MTVVASGYELQAFELYETETWATNSLIEYLGLPAGALIWEPAAGNHKIADTLLASGMRTITSDITVHNREHDFIADFYGDFEIPDVAGIITNPPFGRRNMLAARFARLCLQRCPGWIALLLTAKFDFAKTRMDLFANNPRFAAKVSLLDRIQWFAGENQGTEDHAWYIWAPAPGIGAGNARMAYGTNPAARRGRSATIAISQTLASEVSALLNARARVSEAACL